MFVLYVFFLYAGRQLYVIIDWKRAISVDYCTIFAKILISVAMVTKMIIIKNENIFPRSYIITFQWYQNQPNWLTIMWSHLHDFYLNRHLIYVLFRKQCISRSAGFLWSQLIWIHIVLHPHDKSMLLWYFTIYWKSDIEFNVHVPDYYNRKIH